MSHPLYIIKGVGVPRSLGFRSHETRNPPKNGFYAFSNVLLAECNLSLIFEQVDIFEFYQLISIQHSNRV